MIEPFIWMFVAFISGSVPYSVWIGKRVLGKDIRTFGDGNPGAFNVFRAGGKSWGLAAILLDGFKGAIPVGLARHYGLEGWALVLTALAPILGHAYSPFLRFRGGKAIAVMFGSWLGMTSWLGPTILGIMYTVLRLLKTGDRLTIIAGQLVLLAVLLLIQADWTLFALWLGSNTIIAIKQLGARPVETKEQA